MHYKYNIKRHQCITYFKLNHRKLKLNTIQFCSYKILTTIGIPISVKNVFLFLNLLYTIYYN